MVRQESQTSEETDSDSGVTLFLLRLRRVSITPPMNPRPPDWTDSSILEGSSPPPLKANSSTETRPLLEDGVDVPEFLDPEVKIASGLRSSFGCVTLHASLQ